MAVLQVSVFLVSSLLLMAGCCHSQTVVSQTDEEGAINMIRQLIRNLAREDPPRVNNPTAKLIRLLFHDCVSEGGCNGCIDLNNTENNGLAGIYAEVNTLYDDEFSDTGMSRADFIALAAVVAVRAAADEQDCRQLRMPPNCDPPVPDMTIRYGRTDCATSPDSPLDSGFPDAHGDLEHVMEIFRDGMGMTERQIVALIGAHTMGMATPRNSGFQGPWAPPTNRFDNAFFRTLSANGSEWHQSELNFRDAPEGFNPRYQWDLGTVTRMPQGPPPMGVRMMLNTDMALFKRVSPDANGMETDAACRDLFTDCEESSTADIVLEYARNNTRWHEDFGPAFQILLENGYARSELAEAVEVIAATSTEEPTDDDNATDVAISIRGALIVLAMGALIAALFQ